jgi:S-adenosylmethionine decarboxylase
LDALGTHLLLELRECDSELLDDVGYIEQAMGGAAAEAGATVLDRAFHKFDPRGVTGIIAIAESHLCIHTWPEHRYAAVDIFTCGSGFLPQRAAELIIERLRCAQPSITAIERGPLARSAPSPV